MRQLFLLFTLLVSPLICCGQQNFKPLLDSIEANNFKLKEYRQRQLATQGELDFKNRPPNPVLSSYYLPFGNHNTPDYLEFEFVQQFEFPTVYSKRKEFNDSKKLSLELQYQQLRQEVLVEALQHIVRWKSLTRGLDLRKERLERLKEFKGEQSAILQLQTRVKNLETKHRWRSLENEIDASRRKLRQLNGGQNIEDLLSLNFSNPKPLDFESVWQEVEINDPRVLLLQEREQIAEKKLTVKKTETLPNVLAGYNFQGVPQSNYHGFYAGLSIPLWSSRKKIESAKAAAAETELSVRNKKLDLKLHLKSLVEDYNGIYLKIRSYELLQKEIEAAQNSTNVEESEKEIQAESKDLWQLYFDNKQRLLELREEILQLQIEIFQHRL